MALQTKTLTANGAKGHHQFTLTVSENSTSTANNTSALSFSFVLSPIQTSWNWEQWGSSISYTVTINGSNYTGTIPAYDGYSSVTLKSGSLSVGHNSEGSKIINISFSVVDGAGQYYTCGNASSSSTMTLTTIQRASQPSIITYPNTTQNIGNIGSTVYVHMNRNSTSFTHTVRYAFGSLSGTIATGVTSNCQWTIPTSFYAQIPSATSGTGTVYCDTYNGGTLIGTKSVSFTTTVSSSVVPAVGTITLTPQTYSHLIQNKNKLNIGVSGCSAGAGSSIKSYTFSGPGISNTTTSTSVTSGTVSNTGTLTYTVKVTDNRGRTASKSATITCYEYSKPYFTSFNAYRAKDTNGTSDPDGKYLHCTYGIRYSGVNGTNNVSVKAYYVTGATTKSTTGSNGVVSVNLNENAKTYDVYLQITDSYSGVGSSSVITVFGSSRILNITQNGTGVAIGKLADQNEFFDVRWKSQFRNDVVVDGNLIATGLFKVTEFSVTPSDGTITITLPAGDNIDNYRYLEIFYTDNNGNGHNSTKVYDPNGRQIDLSLVEATDNNGLSTYIRRTMYVIAGDGNILTITPSAEARGYIHIVDKTIQSTNKDKNYIKIIRVLGYR